MNIDKNSKKLAHALTKRKETNQLDNQQKSCNTSNHQKQKIQEKFKMRHQSNHGRHRHSPSSNMLSQKHSRTNPKMTAIRRITISFSYRAHENSTHHEQTFTEPD